jgi:hypothetical protein
MGINMKKLRFYKFLLIFWNIWGIIAILYLYVVYFPLIRYSVEDIEGVVLLILILLVRIGLLSVATIYMFHRWFIQEKQYLSDLPLLFGLFFLFLTYGKALDLFWDLIYSFLKQPILLLFLKIRYFIVILTAAPMMYLSIGMILYYLSLKEKYSEFKEEKRRNRWAKILLVIIIFFESSVVIIAPNIPTLSILLPIIVLPSFAIIVWLFYFAYKNKALSQVNTKVLAIGFGALLFSQILRPILQFIIGPNIIYLIIVEIIDFLVFLIIIGGFFTKIHYSI